MTDMLRRDSVLTIAAIAVLAAAYLLLIERPGRNDRLRLDHEIAQAEQAIREIPLRVAKLSAMQADIASRQRLLAGHRQLIPPEPHLHGVIREVARLAEEAALKVTRLEPLAAETHPSYRRLPMRITLTGGFQGLASFVKGLETHPRLFTFEQCVLRNSPGLDGVVEADVHFSAYAGFATDAGFAEIADSRASPTSDTKER